MYLIYVDEYGDTGARLDDPRQPLFGLVAAFIPEAAWVTVETSLIDLILEIQDTLGTDETPRLHIVDLYQRKGVYRRASVEQCFAWIERVFTIAHTAQVRYHARVLNKSAELERYRRSSTAKWREAAQRGEASLELYVAQFPVLLLDIDAYCEQTGEHALLFVDQHERTRHLDTLTIYRAWRSVGLLKRTLEAPIQRDGRFHALLALPDFAGYAVLGTELDKLRQKQRPKLGEWADTYVTPYAIDYQPSGIDLRRALAVSNFYLSESDRGNDLARAIAALKAGLGEIE